MGALIVIVATFGLVWVLFILPQQRRIREHQAVVASLQVGDEVMTTAGIYGRVAALDDEVVTLEVAPGTALRVARGAVGHRVDPAGAEATATADQDESTGTPA